MKKLTLRYVTQTKNGSFEYRRQVPKLLRERVGIYEFKKVLGSTEAQAIREWPKFHEHVERALVAAKRPQGTPVARALPLTAMEIYREAVARLKEDGIDPTGPLYSDPDNWGSPAEMMAEHYPVRDAVDSVAHGMLNSSGNAKPPAPTFMDAVRLYIQTKIDGLPGDHRKRLRVNHVADFVRKASGQDPMLVGFTRSNAREVVAEMLSTDIKPTTVDRYCNDIRAIWAFGIQEFELGQATFNPFLSLDIKGLKVVGQTDRDERHSFKPKQLTATRAYILDHAGTELQLIWRVLEGTGTRLSETVGLQIGDVVIDGNLPHLDIRFNSTRRLKNTSSVRKVPLVGDALVAMRQAMDGKTDAGIAPEAAVFDKYGRVGGNNVASAALMKNLRKVVSDPKVTVHSLRHTLQDKMIVAGISEHDRHLILGHAVTGEANRYGSDEARLIATTKAMALMLSPKASDATPSVAP